MAAVPIATLNPEAISTGIMAHHRSAVAQALVMAGSLPTITQIYMEASLALGQLPALPPTLPAPRHPALQTLHPVPRHPVPHHPALPQVQGHQALILRPVTHLPVRGLRPSPCHHLSKRGDPSWQYDWLVWLQL